MSEILPLGSRKLDFCLSVCVCVCLSVCPDDNFRTDDQIEFKLCIRLLGPNSEVKFEFGENWTRRFKKGGLF